MQLLRHIIVVLTVTLTVGGCTWRNDSTQGFYTTADGITVTPDSIIGPDGDILTAEVPVADVDGARRLSRLPRIITSSAILDALCYNELYAIGDSIDIDIDNIETALLLMPHTVATHGGQPVCRTVITDIMRHLAGVGTDTPHALYERGTRLMYALTDTTYDIHLQMYAGTPARYTRDMLPPWLDAAGRHRLLTADIAADCHRALALLEQIAPHDISEAHSLPVISETLAAHARTALWMPQRGTLSAYLYTYPYPIQLPATDNRATAKAVIDGMLTPVMARTAVAMTPVTDTGITIMAPLPPDAADTHADATTAALRAVAACRVNNSDARDHALATLMLGALNGTIHSHGRLSVTTAILRGILGISISSSGLAINPSVPAWLTAGKSVTGLHYRDAVLDITVRGTGNIISTFAIDNIASRDHIVPPDLSGHHTVTVTLTGATREQSGVNITPVTHMPAEPRVTWRGTDAAIAMAPGSEAVTVYVDGEHTVDTDSRYYAARQVARTRWYCFASLADDGIRGFVTEPYPIIPQEAVITLPASAVGTTGSRILSDKVTVRRRRRTYTQYRPSKYEASTVESTIWHNQTLAFTVDIDTPGLYAIDMLYLNGLGIVNADRETTTRTVSVNGREVGRLTFTQLSPQRWQPDTDWRALTAYSDMLFVDLDEGLNAITVEQPPVNNDDDNLLLVKELRIIRL